MDSIISVQDVSMHFRMDKNHTTSLKEWVVSWLKGKQQYETFQALNHVSFEVQKGEILGIVGRNGAGKSTLLKAISGIYRPTSGKVITAGRVAPMLELGSGFDPELSGHDNIFLNGAILGFSEEFLKTKYDDIVAFSELGDFIYQPTKTYSSGMMMRLAFSVATIIEPEILIVDEILAVGDAPFQEKSRARMMELMSGGTTVLFVSHNLDQIRTMCDRALWLDHGEVRMIGETKEVCDAYEQM
ncbi:MAG: ABC transporter ATP-binding protein [Clostridia bacterium]|nr:ABC transporter ATP-binding protein [Clostridia bacterium]